MKVKLITTENMAIIVGRRIAYYRNRLGITQEEFGSRVGVHQTTVAVWESGKQVPSRRNMDKIIEVLGIDRSTLEVEPTKRELDRLGIEMV